MANSDIDKTHEAFLKLSQSHNGWLIKNTGSIIALTVVFATFALWFVMLTGVVKGTSENILFAINGGLTTTVGFILSFYFGTSKTEADAKRQSLAVTSSGGDTPIENSTPIPTPTPTPIPNEAVQEPEASDSSNIPDSIKELIPDKVQDIIDDAKPILEKAEQVMDVAKPILDQAVNVQQELSSK